MFLFPPPRNVVTYLIYHCRVSSETKLKEKEYGVKINQIIRWSSKVFTLHFKGAFDNPTADFICGRTLLTSQEVMLDTLFVCLVSVELLGNG